MRGRDYRVWQEAADLVSEGLRPNRSFWQSLDLNDRLKGWQSSRRLARS